MESLAVAAACTSLYACAGPPDSPPSGGDAGRPPDLGVTADLAESGGFVSTYIDARPAALVDGRVVEWGEMRPLLNEAAGATILQEVVLDRLLERETLEAGVLVTTDDVDAERQLFYETLSDDPDVAARLGRELRARQGLGRRRMTRLLQRNAALRALVRDQVTVSEEAVRRAYEVAYGPRRQARLLIVPSLADAQAAIDRIEAGEFFGDVAVDVSTDTSASRGGLLEPISRADPSYPQVLRETLWTLDPGGVSPPILLAEQYAVLMLVGEVEPRDVEIDDVRPTLERRVRRNQERILMDRLARRLLAEASITIIDEAIKESWDFQGGRDR